MKVDSPIWPDLAVTIVHAWNAGDPSWQTPPGLFVSDPQIGFLSFLLGVGLALAAFMGVWTHKPKGRNQQDCPLYSKSTMTKLQTCFIFLCYIAEFVSYSAVQKKFFTPNFPKSYQNIE